MCLSSSAAGARLEVFNECPPMPGWNPEKPFEPFYRPDTARNARTGGNGLGLAICRAIATANGWTVALRQEPGGVRAVACFPGRPAAVQPAGG
jgi:two-component system, OmpR family, sensor kinase